MTSNVKERNIISDALVVEKTGKTMEHWFTLLDKKGAQSLKHVDIYNLVAGTPGLKALGQWNHNLLTTTYEWNRGLKERGQKEDGFEVSVSKTINVPLSVLYIGFVDNKIRSKWLGKESITFRKTTENKSARVTWSDGETSLSVDFYTKGENKSQVVVQHQKIQTSGKAFELKNFWGEKLQLFKELLEK